MDVLGRSIVDLIGGGAIGGGHRSAVFSNTNATVSDLLSTVYHGLLFTRPQAIENKVSTPIIQDTTVISWSLSVETNLQANNCVLRLRKNGVDTPASITVPALSTGTFAAVGLPVSYAVGDRITISVNQAVGASLNISGSMMMLLV